MSQIIKKAIFVGLALAFIMISGFSYVKEVSANELDPYYITYEGVAFKVENIEGAVVNLFINNDEEVFILSGLLGSELGNSLNKYFVITGVVTPSSVLQTKGIIHVESYRIDEDNIKWIVGTVYSSSDGIIVVGDDQNIYKVIPEARFKNYENRKVVFPLSIMEWLDEFTAVGDLGPYRIKQID